MSNIKSHDLHRGSKELLDLLKFCKTETQTERVKAMIEHGNSRQAGESLGVSKSTINNTINQVKELASIRGFNPEYDQNHPAPKHQIIRGISTLYNSDGQLVQQWVKTKSDDDMIIETINKVVESLNTEIKPYNNVSNQIKKTDADLLNVVVITDYHIGMLAWEEEGGRNWNMNIASEVLNSAVIDMVDRSPKAKEGILCFLGDTLHYDGLDSVTTMSKNPLDSDSRYGKMIDMAIDMIKVSMDKMINTHEKVTLLIAEGNHDLIGSQWLQRVFKYFYKDTPCVEVICSPKPYYCMVHGKTMITAHHGHLKKSNKLFTTIPAMFSKEWGQTEYRYCLTGHIHHSTKNEEGGIIVESFQTLVAQDAYSSRHGFMSSSSAVCITYHKEYGEYSRITTRPIK